MKYKLDLRVSSVLPNAQWSVWSGFSDLIQTRSGPTISGNTPEEIVQKLADELDVAIEIKKPNQECGAV